MLYFLKRGAYPQSKSTVVHYTHTVVIVYVIFYDRLVVKKMCYSNKTSTCTHLNLKFFTSKMSVELCFKNVLFVVL